MTGLHSFAPTEVLEGTRLVHSETFSGSIVPAILPILQGALRRRFVEMNEALRSELTRRHRP